MGEKTAGIKKPESVRFFAHFKLSASRIQELIKEISVIYPDAEMIIWMRYIGYSDREIQEISHIPRRTFEYNIATALKKLNVHIDDYL